MLSEEEKNAINILLDIYCNKCAGEELTINEKVYIGIAIGLIKRLQKENKNKQLSNQILMLLKEEDNFNARIEKKNEEIEEKNNQIDLMAERIEWLCKSNGILLDIKHGENFNQKDIKQYFEKLAKEKRNNEKNVSNISF